MKLLFTTILFLGIFALNLKAQSSDEEMLEMMAENCHNSLTHENLGIVESAIFISIQFKNKFFNKNMNEIIQELDEIASESESSRISYKAHLAKMYFNNYEWFKNVDVSSRENEQKVYEEIAETISNIMLASAI